MSERIAVCGQTFCERCGDCLACYGGDPCYDGAFHQWPDDAENDDEDDEYSQ